MSGCQGLEGGAINKWSPEDCFGEVKLYDEIMMDTLVQTHIVYTTNSGLSGKL